MVHSLYDSEVLILDANQLGADDLRNSPRFHAYQRIAAHLQTDILLPRISFIEHLQRYKANFVREMTSERDQLISEGRMTPAESMSDKEIGEYTHSQALNYGSEIESMARVTSQYSPSRYQESVERELWRVPPAHPTKGEGARDVLVWFDVLDARGDELIYLISNDTSAFGSDGVLRDELIEEFGTGKIVYFNDLDSLTKHLGLEVPNDVMPPDLAQSTRDAISYDINSPGMFMRLNALIPPDVRQMQAGTAHWDGTYSLGEFQTKYNFSLGGEHFLCYAQAYKTVKSYVLVSMETPLAQPVPWHFHISGYVTVSIRYDVLGVVHEFEILNATIDYRKTTMMSPGGEKISIAEAQRRLFPAAPSSDTDEVFDYLPE